MDHGSFNPTFIITPLIAMTMLLERKLKEGFNTRAEDFQVFCSPDYLLYRRS